MTTGVPAKAMNACAKCKYYKKGFFGKERCTLQKIKTRAEHLCYGYEEKKGK